MIFFREVNFKVRHVVDKATTVIVTYLGVNAATANTAGGILRASGDLVNLASSLGSASYCLCDLVLVIESL